MGNTVIKVENLSKRFLISHEKQERYTSLRDVVAKRAKKIFSFPEKLTTAPSAKEEFWALKDINFEINKGDRVGIIGRNGAGKSTLLKILSRITEPTAGKVTIDGRVASLLEVGTGFHPELTGRENIFLNGAILGMSRAEIRSKFDEIVAFAEVEKFLDTPVKHYSSGMYVRLAFAVAAHLEPEILIVDEVLAVGDAQFQKKCLGKMEDVSKNDGRTVLFVSHNMTAIRSLCNLGIFLENSGVRYFGSIIDCIDLYENVVDDRQSTIWLNDEKNNEEMYLESISILDASGKERRVFYNSEVIILRFKVKANESVKNVKIGFDLFKSGAIVFRSQQVDDLVLSDMIEGNSYLFECEIPAWFLNHGNYSIRPIFSIHMVKYLSKVSDPVISFNVNIDSTKTPYHSALTEDNQPGFVFPQLKWQQDAFSC